MTAELEYKYEVKVERRDKPIRFDASTKEALREAGMMNNNKLKITGVSPKMLKIMKAEYVECPVLQGEVHFVQCFVCPNFQSRLNRMVLCRGSSIAGAPAPKSATESKAGDPDAKPTPGISEEREPPGQPVHVLMRPKRGDAGSQDESVAESAVGRVGESADDSAAKPDTPQPEPPESPPAESDAAKPDAAKPDAAKPDAAKPDAAKPDAAKPDAAKPDAAKPDAAKPDATEPDTNGSDPAEPDTPKPEPPESPPPQPDAAKPDAVELDAAKPDPAKPDKAEPGATGSDPAKPDTPKPDTPKPDTPQPGATGSDPAKPDTPKPDTPKPDAAGSDPPKPGQSQGDAESAPGRKGGRRHDAGRRQPTREDVGITEPKSGDFSEWYTQVVLKAELADYTPVKGMIALRPDGYSIWESVKAAMDAEFAKVGVRNAFLPVLIPESLLTREKTHFEGFNPEVFWVTHSGDAPVGDRLALRPTSETLAYSLYSKWINSWRDLPLKLNFWNTALRAEIKSTKPFLRTSEFLWQEGHTVHATREEAAAQVDTMLDIYRRVIEEHLAIPAQAGRKSAREQFVGAEYTLTVESIMPDGKALQMGTSHLLGQNFAKPFSVKYADRDNEEQYAWQTSWGASWRLIGALIMVHGDDKGLVLPPKVAPIQVVIIPVHSVHGDNVWRAAGDLAGRLRRDGCRAHVDDRSNVTTGYKYGDWEMRGVPLRVEMGPRDMKSGTAVLARRDTGTKQTVDYAVVADTISGLLDAIQSDMLESARRRADSLTFEADSYDSLKGRISGGGFVRARWCGNEKCEVLVKDETGADIRLVDAGEGAGPCVACGSTSTSRALFARGY